MQIFLDTANVEEIRAAHQLGILAGVTTNPTLVAKEGRDFHAVLWEITSFVKGPVSAEVLSLQADEMCRSKANWRKSPRISLLSCP